KAWLIAGEINDKVPAAALNRPMAPEVIYGLLRQGLGTTLADLLNVDPDQFFSAIVAAVHQGTIAASFEAQLRPTPGPDGPFPGLKDSLIDDWRIVLKKMLSRLDSNPLAQWQQALL